MASETDFDDLIDTLVDEPRSVSSPDGSVSNISIDDAIKADKHVQRRSFKSSPFAAIKRAKAVGPTHYGT